MIEKLQGLIAAPFTPLKEDGSLNLQIIPDYYNLLKRNRVSGAFINGSTGEGASLTLSEKMQLAEAWKDSTKQDKSFSLVTLLGGTCLKDCIVLAKHAQQIGLNAVALTAPFYFKPATIEQLAACCVEVGKHVESLPLYYYHIPVLNGVEFPMIELLKKLDDQLPNFAGIKYTHEDFMDFLSCIHFKDGKYDLLWGRDENMLSALVLGTKGAVGSTFNYAAPLYHQLMESFQDNDLSRAAKLQQQSIDMIRLLDKYGGIATGKTYMKAIGLDCGAFRLPVKNMSTIDYRQFLQDLEVINFYQFASK
jgi:N-acetylneuraminate lyase